ncbi:Cnl2/NKP2 family protein-domain-containing protein [Chaetomium strumarium]|uniref:Cnl2/NKP2 family protein-domain-containing protein n=1 Tax=Chaetomium strumarium TaxID=1170767 RepID=A0AAJ0M0Q9_9PEZI|nr:Cnl2/NKP2 family protein-domain-containing protein [Chaetomium strumarium]
MAPTEQTILSNYLLVPAQLPAIISLQEFIALFPRQLQSSPRIRSLYRDLQSQRNVVVDAVAEEIEQEVKQGKAMRRAVIRSKREAEAEAQEQDDEVEIERMLGNWSAPQNPRHSLASILPDMEGAIGALEAELQLLEEEEAALLASVRGTVGGMSDLRYGRLANSRLPEQVLDGLVNLQEICRGKS